MKSPLEIPLCVRSNTIFNNNPNSIDQQQQQQPPNKRLRTECNPAELEQILCEEQDVCIEVCTLLYNRTNPNNTTCYY